MPRRSKAPADQLVDDLGELLFVVPAWVGPVSCCCSDVFGKVEGSAMKRHVIILSYAIVVGTVVTALTLPFEHGRDPFSGVAFRGLPVAVLKLEPKWMDNPAWRISIAGAVFNVVLWSALSGSTVAFVFHLRDRKRRKWIATGHCGNCGYSLFGISAARCPECGTKTEAHEVLQTRSTPDQ